jgi:hypothetical protein
MLTSVSHVQRFGTDRSSMSTRGTGQRQKFCSETRFKALVSTEHAIARETG